jgi:hypothetical protein
VGDNKYSIGKDLPNDPFWHHAVFPDALGLVSFDHQPLSAIKDQCMVVLDANVLLQPYEFGSKEAVSEIERIYRQLAESGRLVVPGQSVREFLLHRPQKLASVASKLRGAIKRLRNLHIEPVPFLDSDETFLKVKDQATEVQKSANKVAISLETEIDRLRENVSSDRLSVLYRDVFANSIFDENYSEDRRKELIAELSKRYELRIPPGFKDGGKTDFGIGDYLIWKTILAEGSRRGCHCLFVTMEEKADWWVRDDGAFQPRPELIDEYRRITGGKTLRLAPLSKALSAFSVSEEVVADVKTAEVRSLTLDEINDGASSRIEDRPSWVISAKYSQLFGIEENIESLYKDEHNYLNSSEEDLANRAHHLSMAELTRSRRRKLEEDRYALKVELENLRSALDGTNPKPLP